VKDSYVLSVKHNESDTKQKLKQTRQRRNTYGMGVNNRTN